MYGRSYLSIIIDKGRVLRVKGRQGREVKKLTLRRKYKGIETAAVVMQINLM
jgi:hypothetical protein